MKFRPTHERPQKCDHGGSMIMLPRTLLTSAAWIELGSRGRDVILVICARFNGYNNGAIPISIEEIGKALGNQNHGANGRALTRAIELGFIECMAGPDHHQGKAREYRLTYIETGEPGRRVAATHEYRDWRPTKEKRQFFFAAQSACKNGLSNAESATPSKLSTASAAGGGNDKSGLSPILPVEDTAALICYHSSGISGPSRPQTDNVLLSLAELREWLTLIIRYYGRGTQRTVARDANIPEPSLSKFIHGASLALHFRAPLQKYCSHYVPYAQRHQYAAELAGGGGVNRPGAIG